jgi:hypothetical protein
LNCISHKKLGIPRKKLSSVERTTYSIKQQKRLIYKNRGGALLRGLRRGTILLASGLLNESKEVVSKHRFRRKICKAIMGDKLYKGHKIYVS